MKFFGLICALLMACTIGGVAEAQEMLTHSPFHYVQNGSLTYGRYTITHSTHEWKEGDLQYSVDTIVVKKSGKVILTETTPEEMLGWSAFALFPFLGGNSKQLLITGYTGGANCCLWNEIYGLGKEFRPIFDSGSYGDDFRGASDLDLDDAPDEKGRFGFSMMLYTFVGFERYSHAGSPDIPIELTYDPKEKRYLPKIDGNCSADPGDVEASIEALGDLNKSTKFNEKYDAYLNDPIGDYLSAVMAEVVPHFYAGHADAAWKVFDSGYRLPDKEHIRKRIREELAGSKVYEEVQQLAKVRDTRCEKELGASPAKPLRKPG